MKQKRSLARFPNHLFVCPVFSPPISRDKKNRNNKTMSLCVRFPPLTKEDFQTWKLEFYSLSTELKTHILSKLPTEQKVGNLVTVIWLWSEESKLDCLGHCEVDLSEEIMANTLREYYSNQSATAILSTLSQKKETIGAARCHLHLTVGIWGGMSEEQTYQTYYADIVEESVS
jgi:hypothetical protein